MAVKEQTGAQLYRWWTASGPLRVVGYLMLCVATVAALGDADHRLLSLWFIALITVCLVGECVIWWLANRRRP